MPCLNEAETLEACIEEAKSFLKSSGVSGEILIADNGSTDGSIDIAEKSGARVTEVGSRGYGSALLGGIAAARGKYTIMGDADQSYDFSHLMPYRESLRDGFDLVMGNRFMGGIEPGAMPFLHRYLGNPVLSWLGRLFFKIPVGDFHCGLRGFNTDSIRSLNLNTTGMEFASELVVKSSLSNLRMCEVPTVLRQDGRTRPPHLRTWRDGWRHLVFLLIFSPKWLFFYPGLAATLLGLLGVSALFGGGVQIGKVGLDIHTFAISCAAIAIGAQSLCFAAVSRRYCTTFSLIPCSQTVDRALSALTLERVLICAGILTLGGITGITWCISKWAAIDFGGINTTVILRILLLSLTGVLVGFQLGMTAFISRILEIPVLGSSRN